MVLYFRTHYLWAARTTSVGMSMTPALTQLGNHAGTSLACWRWVSWRPSSLGCAQYVRVVFRVCVSVLVRATAPNVVLTACAPGASQVRPCFVVVGVTHRALPLVANKALTNVCGVCSDSLCVRILPRPLQQLRAQLLCQRLPSHAACRLVCR